MISLPMAAVAASALLAIHTGATVFDEWSKAKRSVAEDAEADLGTRVADLVDSMRSDTTPPGERDRTITAALGIIESHARRATGSRRGAVAASLVLYDDEDRTQMSIRHRNTGNGRPLGRLRKSLDTVPGHRACLAGSNPRFDFDLKRFGPEGFRSPTQSVCNYRSILIVPMTPAGTGNIRGLPSIDREAPHAFDGSVADKVVVDAQPLIEHLRHQIQCEEARGRDRQAPRARRREGDEVGEVAPPHGGGPRASTI